MGLETEAVRDARVRYAGDWSNKSPCASRDPKVVPTVFYWDGMEYLHGFNPKKNPTVEAFKADYAYTVSKFMRHDAPSCHTYIIGYDQRRGDSYFIPKQVHTDDDRAARKATKETKLQEKLAAMTPQELEAYHKEQVTTIDVNGQDPHRRLPTDWAQFLADRGNRWLVFQLMIQTLLDPRFITMQVGKMIVIMGLPFLKGPPVSFDQKVVYGVTLVDRNITQDDVDADPELFGRCLWIKGHQEPMRQAVTLYLHYPDWDCPLWEADMHPVHFYRFMPNQNWLVRSNDRDMLLTLLAHSLDRRVPGSDDFHGHMYLWMPNKSKKALDNWSGDYYVNMNELCRSIETDDALCGDTYNRVLTYVFVMLLTGSDCIRKDMFYNLSTKHILQCFYEHSSIYKHMVQLSNLLIPDASAIRIPLIDERAAMDFISRVYLMKYGPVIEKRKTDDHAKLSRKLKRDYERAYTAWEKECARITKLRERYRTTRQLAMDMDEDGDGDVHDDHDDNFPPHLRFPDEPVPQEAPELDSTVGRSDIRGHTSKYKAAESTLPSRSVCRRDVRHATIYLLYVINAGRNQSLFERGGLFDPLAVAKDGETSYWGYEPDPINPGKCRMSEYVYEEQDLVTFKYPQNYLENMIQKRGPRVARAKETVDALRRQQPISQSDYDRKRQYGVLLSELHPDAFGGE